MEVAEKQKISFVHYSGMMNWSVRYLIENNFGYNHTYTLFSIGDFIQRNRNTISIEDEVLYSRVTIKLYNKGVKKRDEAFGKDIGTKKQYLIKLGQFILSKIDARNGAFGIVPEDLNGAVTTADFLSYEIDRDKINPYFLKLLTSTKQFLAYCQGASSGTTGRQRINEQSFLNAKIPLPSLDIQNQIASAYNRKVKLAEQQEQEAKQFKKEIEDYLVDILGIEKLEKKKELKFTVIQFKSIEKWDVWNQPNTLKTFIYKSIKLENCLSPIQSRISKVQKKYFKRNGLKPIVSQEKEFISGYTDIDLPLIDEGQSLIIFGDHSQTLKLIDFPFIVGADGVRILKPSNKFNPKYFFYYLESIKFETSQKYTRHYKYLKNEFIPLPPIRMQNEIASTIEKMKSKIKALQEQAEENRSLAIEEFEKEIFHLDPAIL